MRSVRRARLLSVALALRTSADASFFALALAVASMAAVLGYSRASLVQQGGHANTNCKRVCVYEV